MNPYNKNNFDLIRLFAALQVVLSHYIQYFHVQGLDWLYNLLLPFSGVPVFFFISGLLISAAWSRNPDIGNFLVNRFYRIFPGLWVCVFISVISLLLFYNIETIKENGPLFFTWIIGQVTIFFQVWTPGFLKNYGTGSVNGSLWTISVELCFYLFVPLFFWFLKYSRCKKELILGILILLSFSSNYFLINWHRNEAFSVTKKIIYLSFIPWLGMFCCGMLANFYLARIQKLIKSRLMVVFFLFLIVTVITFYFPIDVLFAFGNSMGIMNFITVSFLTIALAFSNPGISDKILKKNDFSYGVYIYHQPMLNIFVVLNILNIFGLLCCLAITIVLAVLSWFFVEKPALRFKTKTIHKR